MRHSRVGTEASRLFQLPACDLLRLLETWVVDSDSSRSKILDETLPNWHETTAGTNKIEHYIYDPADPKHFYVYPKAVSGTHSLEIVYSSAPSEISISNFDTDTTTISLDDVYANCILDYMLYRAYQKDSEYAGNAERSMMHYQSFSNALGVKTQADGAITPMPNGPDRNAGRM